jgi:hypothetical protein
MSTYRLQNLLSPGLVALVGAGPRQGSVGRAILGNIRKANFRGEFGLVNSHYAEIDGVASVASLGKLPFVPELVAITAPATTVPGLIEQAGAGGARRVPSSLPPGSAMVRARWRTPPSAPRINMAFRRNVDEQIFQHDQSPYFQKEVTAITSASPIKIKNCAHVLIQRKPGVRQPRYEWPRALGLWNPNAAR